MPDVTLESNDDEVFAWVKSTVASWDFTRPGKDESLGRDLAGVAAEGIAERTEGRKLAADGSQLRDNEEPYATRKERDYDVAKQQPGVRTGQMLSQQSLLGATTIGPDEVVMKYGTNEPPERTRRGGWKRPKLQEQDQKVTDRQKAEWFTEQGRPFYALDDAIADELVKTADESLTEYLR